MLPGDDLSGRDADAEMQSYPRQGRDLEAHDRVLHGEGRADGTLGIVRVADWSAEEGHHAVADEIGDGAAVTLDRVAHDRQEPVQEVQRHLRRVLGGECRVATHVGEQGGDAPPIAAERDRGGITEDFGGDARAHVTSEHVGQPILQCLRAQQ